MNLSRVAGIVFAAAALAAAPSALAQSIQIRITPPDKAQFLQHQLFDIRVEATASGASDTVTGLAVLIDGVDVTARGKVEIGTAANVRNWIYRDTGLGIDGPRVFTASATGTSGSAAITGTAKNTVTIRPWDQSQRRTGAAQALLDSGAEFEGAARASVRAQESFGTAVPVVEELHLGALDPAFHQAPDAYRASTQHKAKNVILLIGDGMGAAHRTAARVLSKGYTQGKANAPMAMDKLPFNGLLMTSSLNSLITDSAPGAHNYSTGNKTNNGMEGVFPDNTAAEDDNPRLEHLSMFVRPAAREGDRHRLRRLPHRRHPRRLPRPDPEPRQRHAHRRPVLRLPQLDAAQGPPRRRLLPLHPEEPDRLPPDRRAERHQRVQGRRLHLRRDGDGAERLHRLRQQPPPPRPLQPRQHERRLRQARARRPDGQRHLHRPAVPQGHDEEGDRGPREVPERLLPDGRGARTSTSRRTGWTPSAPSTTSSSSTTPFRWPSTSR